MGWPYGFVDLTDSQKQERRVLLDWYSALAQISVLVPLLVVQCYFLLSRYTRQKPLGDGRGSPQRKGAREGPGGSLAKAQMTWRTFLWHCGDPVSVGGFYLGRKGEILVALGWLSWLLLLCFLQTGHDYLHLTKRFGIVAASQLPLHCLLVVKHPYSPLQMLTRSSHERLNAWHQLLGRIIITLLYLHATFYLNFYIQSNLLSSKLREFYVWCGIISVLGLTVIGSTALAPVRKWNYRVFYTAHVVISAALLPILFFHVSHIRLYLYEAGAIYVLNVILRNLDTSKFEGSVDVSSDGRLIEITLPQNSPGKQELRPWQPGQHGYLGFGGKGMSQKLNANPFSVASIPSIDAHVKFVARVLGGNTARLAKAISAGIRGHRLEFEGPYGVSHHVETLLQYDRVLFIAGGVGGTFVVPLYRALLSDLSPSRGSYRRQKVTFIWAARSMTDVKWALPEDGGERAGFLERSRVYLTGPSDGISGAANGSLLPNDYDDEDDMPAYAETDEGIELEQRKELLSSREQMSRSVRKDGEVEWKIFPGRPDLKRAVDRAFSHGAAERVAIFVCGPSGLSRSVRREVGRWAERDVWFWEEDFAL